MKEIQYIDTYVFGETVRNESNFADGRCYMLSDRSALPGLYQPGVPFIPIAESCVRVREGHADYIMNLVCYSMDPGDILLVPEDSIFEVVSVSEDLSIDLCSMPGCMPDFRNMATHVHIEDDSVLARLDTLFALMKGYARDDDMSKVNLVQMLYLEEIKSFSSKETRNTKKDSRSKKIFDEFIHLVNTSSLQHRRVEYYASCLRLSANWLSNVIKNYSGKTVMEWINMSVLQQAKAELVYSDRSISGISEKLNFPSTVDFSRFFKRETGVSPSYFRKMAPR